MIVIGHRGCAEQYPENTIQAVLAAAEHVDRVEIDVRRCESGELLVFCDATLERVTEKTGTISEIPWEILQNVEILGSGETIPRLSDLLAAAPPSLGFHIDLKEDGIVADVVSVSTTIDNDVHLCAADVGRLQKTRDAGWTGPLGYIFHDNPVENVAVATDLGCRSIEAHHTLCLQTNVVAAAHDAGVQEVIGGGGINNTQLANTLPDAGVDGLMVDRWDIVPKR
jgi:glycerophosphoryl diester phosphodiesterase